jgi:hypothetical protein
LPRWRRSRPSASGSRRCSSPAIGGHSMIASRAHASSVPSRVVDLLVTWRAGTARPLASSSRRGVRRHSAATWVMPRSRQAPSALPAGSHRICGVRATGSAGRGAGGHRGCLCHRHLERHGC